MYYDGILIFSYILLCKVVATLIILLSSCKTFIFPCKIFIVKSRSMLFIFSDEIFVYTFIFVSENQIGLIISSYTYNDNTEIEKAVCLPKSLKSY